ncbi:MAG: peroxide stress protein YaaA, partial [Litorivicinus sp.]
DFQQQAQALVEVMRTKTPADIATLMKLSDKLAHLNFERFATFNEAWSDAGTHAVMAFNGDVYQGLDAPSLDTDGLAYLNEHLRILSGLYGLLRPLDQMQAYRLEMGTALANPGGKNLYEFWGRRVTDALEAQAEALGTDTLVNLASNEYSGVVDLKGTALKVVTPVFKDFKTDRYKIISFYAKKARGLMARYMADHRLTDVAALKGFDVDGYAFDADESTATQWVFKRRLVP